MVFRQILTLVPALFFLLLAPLAQAETQTDQNIFKNSRELLFSATKDDLKESYRTQLEKAVISLYKAAQDNSESPEFWIKMGRLSETRALWAQDPALMDELMEEAQGYFARAARLDFEAALTPELQEKIKKNGNPGSFSDPFFADLLWSGRLRRGEITYDELKNHYRTDNNIPEQLPNFWRDRFFLISKEIDLEKKTQTLKEALNDFEQLWAIMPVEVPFSGTNKFGPQKLKKIEVLEAFAETLINLSATEENQTLSREIFNEALKLYPKALSLPLDRHELGILSSGLDAALVEAQDHNLASEIWLLKDDLYIRWLKVTKDDPEIWAQWGQDLYSRADSQPDDRIWNLYLDEAAKKYQKSIELSPRPVQSLIRWGQQLEYKTYFISPYLVGIPKNNLLSREHRILSLAREKYLNAYNLDSESLPLLKALVRISLKLAVAETDPKKFTPLFEEAVRFNHLAIARDPDTAGAWLNWGADCISYLPSAKEKQSIREIMMAETFTAFNQYLRTSTPQPEDLTFLAKLIWESTFQDPPHRLRGLLLLTDICRKLTELKPNIPDYSFALGLVLYSRLTLEPMWPFDSHYTDSEEARASFRELLATYRKGLELLSESSPPASGLLLNNQSDRLYAESTNSRPSGKFLSLWPDSTDFLGNSCPSATFPERLVRDLNQNLYRLLSISRPEDLPPWYKLHLASFFRFLAASGYTPEEEQMSMWRFAAFLLEEAQKEILPDQDRSILAAGILAEEGLVMAEMTLISKNETSQLLETAENLWNKAEELYPSSSLYAKTRFLAWEGNIPTLKKMLSHPPSLEDSLIWPSFSEATNDPAFRKFRGELWFKQAWFNYSRLF